MLYASILLSPTTSETGAIGDHAARIWAPGATKSGYKEHWKEAETLVITEFLAKKP